MIIIVIDWHDQYLQRMESVIKADNNDDGNVDYDDDGDGGDDNDDNDDDNDNDDDDDDDNNKNQNLEHLKSVLEAGRWRHKT